MKAVSCLQGALSVVDLPTPQPGRGQLLLDVRRCGICGSDCTPGTTPTNSPTSWRRSATTTPSAATPPPVWARVLRRGARARPRGGQGVHPGHDGGVVSRCCGHDGGVHLTGLSPLAPGAYAEQVLAEASLSFAVPNGLDVDTAALTEPMAVALHAVRRSEIGRRDVAVVIGCGPVGLAVICHLKAKGVGTIVASDFSPGRRALAARCGARRRGRCRQASPYAAQDREGRHHLGPRRSTSSASVRWRSCASCPAGRTCIGSPTGWAPPDRSGR